MKQIITSPQRDRISRRNRYSKIILIPILFYRNEEQKQFETFDWIKLPRPNPPEKATSKSKFHIFFLEFKNLQKISAEFRLERKRSSPFLNHPRDLPPSPPPPLQHHQQCKKIARHRKTPWNLSNFCLKRNDPAEGGMREQTSKARGWLGARKADGPLHPQSYYNRSSESLLKRVYTGLGVDSGRPSWSLVSAQLRSFVPSLVQRPRLYIYTCSYRQCVHTRTPSYTQ